MSARKCFICNCSFRGRSDAKTCSPRCRKRLQLIRDELTERPAMAGRSSRRHSLKKSALILLLGLSSLLGLAFSSTPHQAKALTPASNLNFQARLLNAAGAVVPDGNYNIDFKIYNADSTTGTVGSCSGACLWEETRVGGNQVAVVNGYFSVNLGSVTSFPAINWDQQLYLTMNIGGTGAPSWDGEMQNAGHSIALTSVPLAFRANQLAVAGTNEQILQFANNTFGQATTISLPDPGAGTATICYQNASACGFASASGSGSYIQNSTSLQSNANFNIQSSALGSVGGIIRAAAGQSADLLQLSNSSGNPLTRFNSNGDLAIGGTNSANSTSAFQVQNSSGASLLNVDSTNSRIGVDVTYSSMGTPGTVTPTNSSGGSLSASTTYFYKITAIDSAGGETTVSPEASCKTSTSDCVSSAGAGKLTIVLNWSAVSGASGYKIYRSTTTNSEVYLTTIYTNSFTDNGVIPIGSGSPPGSNTAFTATNNSNSLNQLSIGGLGKATGQLYVSGTGPVYISSTAAGLSAPAGIVTQGTTAFVVNTTSAALTTYDIGANPASPRLLASATSNLTNPVGVAVLGKYAYVANGSGANLVIYNISNPSNPSYLSNIATNGPARSVAVQGRYAYVVTNPAGDLDYLDVYDVSNPASPVLLSAQAVGSSGSLPNTVFVQGRYAYITTQGDDTLRIFDISNPSNPTLTGSTTTNLNGAFNVSVSGRYAYVVNSITNNLSIFDVNDPTNIAALSTISTNLSSPRFVQVQGHYAYVASRNNSTFAVFDISNPSAPVALGTNTTTLNNPQNLYVAGRYAYVTSITGNTLTVFDLGGAYIQQLEAGGTETGTLQVDNSGVVAGDFNVNGGLQVGQSLQTSDNLGVQGGAYIQGATVLGGGSNILGPPSGTPSISFTGSTGGSAVTWSYVVTTVNAYGGESTGSNTATISSPGSSSSTLSGSNHNDLSWGAVTGATLYRIYRTAATGGTPSSTGYIGSTTGTTFSDTGIASTGASAPTTDTTGQLTVKGTTLIKSTTNTTAAFQVQNAAGVSFLTADTSSNNLIQIGSSTTDATAVLSVLDSYNNGTDPTGVNGAMYYNTSLNAFRCYTNGTWANCNASAITLSQAYTNGSSSADQTINLTNGDGGGVVIKDNSTPITGSMFTVQSNGGTKYLDVSSAKITVGENTVGNATATATTATTSGTGTNTTTVTLTAVNSLANGDVIFIDNAGQDYYTRITAGGGTTSLTVDPAVTYENARTVTKYTVQYLGSDGTNFSGATRNQNSFYQGYFLGGVVTGAGSTTYSDANISSVGNLRINTTTGVNVQGTNSTTAFQVQNSSGNSYILADTSGANLSLGNAGIASTIQVGNTTGAVAQTVNIGNNATASSTNTVTIGNLLGTSSTTIQGGTGSSAIALTQGSGGTITIGGTGGASAVAVQCGTGTCGFGNNATDHSTTLGSTTGTSVTTLQSGTGNVLLQAAGSSTTGKIQIGAGSGTSTPDLLALDTGNSTTEPSETDGAMYFNTALNSFRCGYDSVWFSCGVNNIEHSFNFEDDFLGGATIQPNAGTSNYQGVGSQNWYVENFPTGGNPGGTNACQIGYNSGGFTSSHDTPGELRMTATSVGSGDGCVLGSAPNSSGNNTAMQFSSILGAGDVFKANVATNNITNGVERVGFINNDKQTYQNPQSGVWWEFDPSQSATWRYCYASNANATATCANSSTAVATNTFYHLEFRIISSSAVTFIVYADGGTPESNALTSITVDLGGTNHLSPIVENYTSTTTAVTLHLDYIQWSGTITTSGGR